MSRQGKLYKAKYLGVEYEVTAKEWSSLVAKDAKLDDVTPTAIRTRYTRNENNDVNYTPEQIVGTQPLNLKKYMNNTPMARPKEMVGILKNAELLKKPLLRRSSI